MIVERGHIYRVDIEPSIGGEQRGKARPCVVLSETALNANRSIVGIVPLSSAPRPLPPIIVAVPSAGKPTSVALCDQLRAIDKRRIIAFAGILSDTDMAAIVEAIREIYRIK